MRGPVTASVLLYDHSLSAREMVGKPYYHSDGIKGCINLRTRPAVPEMMIWMSM